MGLCANGGQASKTLNSYFHQQLEVELKTEIFIPSYSSLYNALRKPSDVVVLHPDNKTNNQICTNTLSIDFQTAKPNHLKTLLNFKKLILIGNYQQYKQSAIKKIKSYTSCNRFYIVSEPFCLNFVQQFPIFKSSSWETNKLSTTQVPILVIDSKDIVQHSGSHYRVYIHTSNRKDMKIYGLIGVTDENCVIKEPGDGSIQKIKEYYFSALNKNSAKNIVLLHNPKIDSNILGQIITAFLKKRYQIAAPYINIYLAKSLPKTTLQPTEANQEIQNFRPTQVTLAKSPTQKFRDLFIQLKSDQGAQKTQRAYNLLNTLITNIYSNQANDMYRKVKRTNKQICQLLNRKAGETLLDELGFRKDGDNWVNTVQAKYLKIFKTDFDLGYKQCKINDTSS